MSEKPQWLIREDASVPVLIALALRQALGVRAPEALPSLRGLATRAPEAPDAPAALEAQWMTYWQMTVEPQANPSPGPLELIEPFGTLVALPQTGAEELRAAIEPYAAAALEFAQAEHERYVEVMHRPTGDDAYRAYANAISEFERAAGRRAHSFDLNVQVLPLSQRGVWWIGELTIAVTDGLRRDVAAFDAAIRPIIAELA